MKKLPQIFAQNLAWAEDQRQKEPQFFERLTSIQEPEYLWIGCSDSRVPANQITGLLPGEVFVHRNVGNIVYGTDINCLSVIQFAVDVLKVKHIIVCGHYGCGAVNAALQRPELGLIEHWLSGIRAIADRHRTEFEALPDQEQRLDKLCELNVLQQARNVCRSPVVLEAWRDGRDLSVHGWIYRLNNGKLIDLDFCVSAEDEIPA